MLVNKFARIGKRRSIKISYCDIAPITGATPCDEITRGFTAVEELLTDGTSYQKARSIGGELYDLAREENDPVQKRFLQTMAQIVCIPLVKFHALWASDFAVTKNIGNFFLLAAQALHLVPQNFILTLYYLILKRTGAVLFCCTPIHFLKEIIVFFITYEHKKNGHMFFVELLKDIYKQHLSQLSKPFCKCLSEKQREYLLILNTVRKADKMERCFL